MIKGIVVNEIRIRFSDSSLQWTSTSMLTLVLPTALNTRQETGSVKKEWSALVTNTRSLAPWMITPPLAHLAERKV